MLTRLCFSVFSQKNIPPTSASASQSWLELVPWWCPGERPAVSKLGASRGPVQRGPSVPAAVWIWIPALWWHGRKILSQQMYQNKSSQSHILLNGKHVGPLTSPALLSSTMPFCIILFCPHFFFLLSLVLLFSSPTDFVWSSTPSSHSNTHSPHPALIPLCLQHSVQF